MRRILLALFGGLLAASLVLQPGLSRTPENAGPQFTADGKLLRPEGYRRWVFVSSGFGMSYNANAGGNGAPAFTNVFVTPSAYDYFLANGKWPDNVFGWLIELRYDENGRLFERKRINENLSSDDSGKHARVAA